MDFVQAAIGNLFGVLGFALIAFGVMKAFQMATTLNEIKDLLADIKRSNNSNPEPALPPMYSRSGEEMLRALSATQEPPVQPEIIQPR
ncbi:MAG: hypothetical protein ACRD5L_07265 [Bryobacteraceae bacterium]